MRTYNDDSSVVCLFYHHLFSAKKRLIGYSAHNLYDSCRRTEHEYFSLCHCSVQCHTEYFYICIIHSIYNDLIEVFHFHQRFFDLVDVHIVDIFQWNAGNIGSFVCPFCLLFYILRHCRCTVAKCLIFGKLCLIRRNQLFTVFYIMYIINRISSAFFEEWAEDLTVDRLSCSGFIVLLQKLCLQWIMSTKSRITTADEYVFFSGLFCDFVNHCSDLIVCLGCLFRCKSSGVGQDIE